MAARVIRLKGEDTKSGYGRIVPLFEAAYNVLADLRRNQSKQTTALTARPFVLRFPDKHGVYRRVARACQGFENARSRAGIKDFRFHDLRHNWTTRMRDLGMADHTIMAITGHKTPQMLERYYSVREGKLVEAMMEIEAKIRAGFGTKPGTDEKRAAVNFPQPVDFSGGPSRTRTGNPLIKSQLLYH